MLSLLKKYRFILLFTILVAFALYRVSEYKGGARPFRSFQGGIFEASAALQQAVTEGLAFFKNVWTRYIYLVHLQEENRKLREIVADLEKERVRLKEDETANRRLKELLEFKESFSDPLVPAVVIGEDSSGWSQTIVINRGKMEGIQEGMAVVSPNGVIGQILESSRHFSRVVLITDQSSEIAALTQRARARGIVEGLGDHYCRMKYLHVSEDIQEGDIVVSSGMDRIYPKGLRIGTITQVNKKAFGLFQEAELQPAVDFDKLEEVFVIAKGSEPSP